MMQCSATITTETCLVSVALAVARTLDSRGVTCKPKTLYSMKLDTNGVYVIENMFNQSVFERKTQKMSKSM